MKIISFVSTYAALAVSAVTALGQEAGAAFAGGLTMGSPLGIIYSINITPDVESGIGAYSLRDFERAMRQDIGLDGHYLYPAMPYTSYAKMSDEDVRALYTYFMTEVHPAQTPNRANDIPVYLSPRWPMAVWNVMFANDKKFEPQKDKSDE